MKTFILILSLITISLVSCKEKARTNTQTNNTVSPVTSIANQKPHWNIKPFGYDLTITYINYLGFRSGSDGC